MSNDISNEVKPAKHRHNIVLTDETEKRADLLAAMEKRSFNNLVEVLIDKEWERAKPTQPELAMAKTR